jgi:hypothetical protein
MVDALITIPSGHVKSALYAEDFEILISQKTILRLKNIFNPLFDRECTIVYDMDKYFHRISYNHHRIISHHQIEIWKIFVEYTKMIVDVCFSHQILYPILYVFYQLNFFDQNYDNHAYRCRKIKRKIQYEFWRGRNFEVVFFFIFQNNTPSID